jgi:luciferase family oxidoreductase group 1
VAEHHSIQGLVCSTTPILIGHIAATTKTIRVGSSGVMLPNRAPLVVAEQFGTLESMYPGRIDLGVGRAPGGDFQTMRALRRGLAQDGEDFPALLEELPTYLGPERPGQIVKAIPGQNSNVQITLLGSSDFSAQLAAALGLPFAFAAHFAPDALYAAAQFYRERFQPSEVLQTPYLLIAAQVIAAETDAAARRLFTTFGVVLSFCSSSTSSFIQHAIPTGAIAQIQPDRQLLFGEISGLFCRYSANLPHCRSPFYLCFEHVDNLGPYTPSRPETCLLILSDCVNDTAKSVDYHWWGQHALRKKAEPWVVSRLVPAIKPQFKLYQ